MKVKGYGFNIEDRDRVIAILVIVWRFAIVIGMFYKEKVILYYSNIKAWIIAEWVFLIEVNDDSWGPNHWNVHPGLG